MSTPAHTSGPETEVLKRLDFVMSVGADENGAVLHAIDALSKRGHLVRVESGAEPGDSERLGRRAAQEGADVVVAVGGDGTLNGVVNGVLGSGRADCAVGLVPRGTANDFAGANGIPEKPEHAVALLVQAPLQEIDVGECNGRFFVNVASGGFGAQITAETSADVKDVLGGFAYLATGISRIASLKPVEVNVRTLAFRWSGRAYAVSVGNSCQSGGGFRICPHARLDDGRLDLVIVPDVPASELPELIRDFIRLGKHADLEHITYLQTPEVEIRADEPMHFNLDGEPMQGDSFVFRCHPRRLPFVLPAHGSDLLRQ